jgi:diketogulonate reductase-like aldo/keto reductase
MSHAPFSAGLGMPIGRWAMEEHQSGKQVIGISIRAAQLQSFANRPVRPMMVQNRCYAALAWDKQVRTICQAYGIIYQGFSLLTANREVFAAPEIRAIAQRVDAGPAQVIFRFAMQIGMLPLTGTTSEQHMKEDLAVDRFSLSAEELRTIEMIAL